MGLTEDLLALPAAAKPTRKTSGGVTRELEVKGSSLTATLTDKPGTVNEGTALQFLREEGLTPEEWEVTNFRKIAYGAGLESVKFSFRRISGDGSEGPSIDELLEVIDKSNPKAPDREAFLGDAHSLVIGIGDMQFGKGPAPEVQGTVERTMACLEGALSRYRTLRQQAPINHVHIAWLGDHVEGFVSQGGANTWRTVLNLTEQIRLTRRIMLKALLMFAPHTTSMTMVAVPGNHGEAVRVGNRMATQGSDSHDTDCLVAVAEAAELSGRFEHVRFFVPQGDDLTVTLDVGDTRIGHAHGHQWRPGEHFKWWKGQAFGDNPLKDADILLAGHLHHEFVQADGRRLFIQVPALEGGSAWYKNATGSDTDPGIFLGLARGGRMDRKEIIRG